MTDMIRVAWSEDFRHFRSFRGTKCYPQKDDDSPTEITEMTEVISVAWSEDFRHFRSFRGTKTLFAKRL